MSAVEAVIARLKEVGFEIRRGSVDPFGERMPLVQATAWDSRSAQLALIAAADEDSAAQDPTDPWRQLFFAVSGLRHRLRRGHAPAFSTPVLFAVCEHDLEHDLRLLAVELAETYSLFNRVELNIVSFAEGDDEALDLALAPMLPNVREALKDERTVAPADVERFWAQLNTEIRSASHGVLASLPEEERDSAAERLVAALVPEPDSSALGESLQPVSELSMKSFRSFKEATVPLSAVTLIDGTNGSGKSSIVEALELVWSGTTQRIPVGEDEDTYTRHTGRDGSEFSLRAKPDRNSGEPVSRVVRAPVDKLARGVLSQDSISRMASRRPVERFDAFLEATGLRVPELVPRVDDLMRRAHAALNRELGEIGIAPLAAISHDAFAHLDKKLKTAFAPALPGLTQLSGAEMTLGDLSEGSYSPVDWGAQDALAGRLAELDDAVREVSLDRGGSRFLDKPETTALDGLKAAIADLRRRSALLEPLHSMLRRTLGAAGNNQVRELEPPIPSDVALRWHSHLRGLAESLPALRAGRDEIGDPRWRTMLSRYVDSLSEAIEEAPLHDLEQLTRRSARVEVADSEEIPSQLFIEAGFSRALGPSRALVSAIGELRSALDARAGELEKIQASIERHPARRFRSRAPQVMTAVADFELLRAMRRDKSPITAAKTSLVEDMMDQRLFPLVREIVAALVRFEWYFVPMQLHTGRNELRVGGLSTTNSKLDVRLMLNAAERTVFGIGWFLALHLLQLAPERQVLVLDDPAGGLDSLNRAGFVATLRSIVRLARPQQLILTTHDPVLADLLEEELASVAGWPAELTRLRCDRDGSADSAIASIDLEPDDADLAGEERILGIGPALAPDQVHG